MKNIKIYRDVFDNEIPVLIFEKNNIENLNLELTEIEEIFFKIIDSDILFESTCGLDYFILIDNIKYVISPENDDTIILFDAI